MFAKLASQMQSIESRLREWLNDDATHNASRSRHTQLLGWRLFAKHSVNGASSVLWHGLARFGSVRFGFISVLV